MNEERAKDQLEEKFGSVIFNKSPLDSKALLENSQYSDLETIEEDLDKVHETDESYTPEAKRLVIAMIHKTIAGELFLTEKLLSNVKTFRQNQLIGGYWRACEEREDRPDYENVSIEGEPQGQPDFETKNFFSHEAALNGNSPDFFLSGIAYTPKPLSIVSGNPQTGKKKASLMLANYGLQRGYFDKVATNIETDKFDTIKSVEELDTWLGQRGRRLFVLGGADRYLTPRDKGTPIYRRFMKLLKKARDTQNKIWLIAEERPAERQGPPKPLEEYQKEYENSEEAWKEDFVFLREFKDLSPELGDCLAMWIDTVGSSNNFEKEIAFGPQDETSGWDDEFLLGGYIPQYDAIGLEDFTPDFREDGPCDFFKEPPEEESEKESENSLSPLEVELYIAHEVEGKSFRQLEKERDLGRSAIHQRVQKVKKARGEEDNEE